jgi:gluconokinase
VVLGGGAVSRSFWWRQAFAEALAPRPVYHVCHPEIAAIGAAILAAGLSSVPVAVERVEPPPTRTSPGG